MTGSDDTHVDISRWRLQGLPFPREIFSHAVWVCYRFSLSLRDVEDFLAYRGTEVSHRAIQEWEKRLLKKLAATFGGTPRVWITDKLRSYGAA